MSAETTSEYKGVWVFLERNNGAIERVSLEVLGRARELADKLQAKLTCALLGNEIDGADEILRYGADRVLVVNHPLLADYTSDPYTDVMARLVTERKPEILLIGATRNGTDMAGRLAVRLHTGLIAHVVRLDLEAETQLLVGAVPSFGGRILALCKTEKSRPQMATVRPGIFPLPEKRETSAGEVERVEMEVHEGRTRVVSRSVSPVEDLTIMERVVVAGMGTGGDLTLAKQLAKALNAALGVTRPIADKGLASRDRQIGSTGVALRSKLAIVLGASGSSYFASGIDGVETVVAVDSNRDAPIFQHADYCVREDLFKLLPPLIAQLEQGGATHA